MALNKLELLRIFCSAAELGNFKACAVKLALSPQAVTRAVQQLEQLTGEVLFHRNTRQVRLTQFGEQLYQDGRLQLAQLDATIQPKAGNAGCARVGAAGCACGIAADFKSVIARVCRLASADPAGRAAVRSAQRCGR